MFEKRGSGTLEITLKKEDFGHLKKFLNDIKASDNFPIKDKEIKYNGKVYYASKICLNSTILYNNLVDQGCVPRKTLILKPPIYISDKLIHHFIRGYFDGDGNVSYNEETKVYNCNIAGTKEILEYIKKESDLSSNTILPRGKNNTFYVYNFGTISDVSIFYNYIYKDATIFLDRKKDKFDRLYKYLNDVYPQIIEDSLSNDYLVKYHKHGIPVVRISKDLKEFTVYESAKKAALDLKLNRETTILNCCYHKNYESHGYYWLFYREYIEYKDDIYNYIHSIIDKKVDTFNRTIEKLSRKVVQVQDGIPVRIWISYNKAGRGMGCSGSTIYNCIRTNSKNNTYKGYQWYYLENYLKKYPEMESYINKFNNKKENEYYELSD